MRTLSLTALLGACADCSTEPSQCPYIPLTALCPDSSSCTLDGAPIACTPSSCRLEVGQTLSFPLDAAKVSSATPDLLIHFAGGAVKPADVHARIDGVEVAAEATSARDPYVQIKWTVSASSAPKKLELSFSGGAGVASDVDVSFADIACEDAERAACHGGGS